MNKSEIYDNLLKWLQTFELARNVRSAGELADGVIIARILNTIAPSYFSEEWLSKIKPENGSNWRLKVSNLKKVVKAIRDFYSSCLDMYINDFETPDINSIGESASSDELGVLLQLVLGCAVSCQDKEKYIQAIMSMEQQFQQSIMMAIQDLMQRPRAESDIDEKLKKALEDCDSAVQEKERMSQRCHELDYQVSALIEEKAIVQAEADRLAKRVEALESATKSDSASAQRVRSLEEQLELMQDELCRVEAQRKDYKSRTEQLEKDKEDLLRQGGDLAALRDELDVLRERLADFDKTESALEVMKKRAEDTQDLRRQLKTAQQESEESLKRRLELEEEVERLRDSRRQAESLAAQLDEAQHELSEERKRADRATYELSRQASKSDTLQPEVDKLRQERDSLREANEELELQVKLQEPGEPLVLEDGDPVFLGLPLSVKEKLLRLERENARLKQSAEADATVQDLRRQVSDQLTARGQLEAELRRQRERMDELDSRSRAASSRAKELSDQLAKREEAWLAQEDKYKRYLQRAKTVIRALDSRPAAAQGQLQNSNGSTPAIIGNGDELGALKQQLVEKDRVIEQLERAQEKSQRGRELEDRLMVSAWYSLGMQLHQGVAGEYGDAASNAAAATAAAAGSPGQSFLQRQRAASQLQQQQQQQQANSRRQIASGSEKS